MSFKDFVNEDEFHALKEIERATKMTEFGDEDIVQYRFPMDGNPYEMNHPLVIDEDGHIIKLDFGYDIELMHLSKDIECLTGLRLLKIQNWSGKEFPHQYFKNLIQFEEFYLEGNIINFPLTLFRPKLRKITIRYYNQYGKITAIPPDIKNAIDLEGLSIVNFQINSIPPELCTLKKLRWLDLSFSSISSIPDIFSSLENLEYLALAGTKLTEVPKIVLELPSLKKIYLWKTPIQNLSELCKTDIRISQDYESLF